MTDMSGIHSAIVALGPREFASRAGFKVDHRGRGRCPIHGGHNDEQFALTTKRGEVVLAHCFNCGFSGDALDLLGALRGRTDFAGKLAAVTELLGMAPIPANTESFQSEPDRIDPSSYHNVVTALRDACQQFRPIRDVCLYVQQRKLLDLAPEFGLFALPDRARQPEVIAQLCKMFEAETLHKCGLINRDSRGRYNFRQLQWANHRLCIPWTGPAGQIDVLQRRTIDSNKPKYVFPSGIAPMHPFGVAQLRNVPKSHPIAFVEGALDVLAMAALCRREGFGIVPLGLPGVSTWRTSWGELCSARDVYIALDNDKAGNEAFGELAVKVQQSGPAEVRLWKPECGKDWNDELKAAS
jgi:DNA primase